MAMVPQKNLFSWKKLGKLWEKVKSWDKNNIKSSDFRLKLKFCSTFKLQNLVFGEFSSGIQLQRKKLLF